MRPDYETVPARAVALGAARLAFASRLGDDWRRLAIYLEIPAEEQRRFAPGHEAHQIWEWLINRDMVGHLPVALTAIDRNDLATLLPAEPDLARSASWSTQGMSPIEPGAAAPVSGGIPADVLAPPAWRRLTPRKWIMIAAAVGVVAVGTTVALNVNRSPGTSTVPPTTSASLPIPIADGPVIFKDDFSNRASDWRDQHSPTSDHGSDYLSGAFRYWSIAVNRVRWALPTKVAAVYPLAPVDIRVEARVRRVTYITNDWFGISCRSTPTRESYAFLIAGDTAQIVKLIPDPPYFSVIGRGSFQADIDAAILLQAECTSMKGSNDVHLVLSVNGKKIVDATDGSDPIQEGSVGVVVATPESERNGRRAEAEFSHFKVTKL